MFETVDEGPALVVCSTCRHSPQAREDAHGHRGGAALAQLLETLREHDPRYAPVAIQQTACLFACAEHCTVHLRAPGKVSYVMGRFEPTPDAARALLDYALHYARSEEGSVRYALWPDGVKGHFITRTPPAGCVNR
ncbi:DUF1636 domain-containing protein [Novosphingobium sp. 1949]|uniref:DUF1636 domain-containing protein n=1 Tax=Novosphingobium organovorum TaxID=2930092 RepID=A0ABT0B8R8_9SPHN|nr:DUF1636 domain-containing protein [Novosphingobium organovorum]MCJ2181467.1 DUF1636 domain-containing protein [Novosphingobium organovorum]